MIGSTMLTYALYAGMLQAANLQPLTVSEFVTNELPSIDDPQRLLRVETRLEPAESMKTSPTHGWAFNHVSSAFGQATNEVNLNLRFRVFAQNREVIETMGHDANRMLIRLWDYNLARFKQSQNMAYPIVDVYLCKEGTGGGEHGLGHDEDDLDNNHQARAVSMIHIFQIETLTDKMERLRELAHEYGHAAYPEVGTFEAPESWGNGYAAERIYIKWLYEDVKAKKINATDTMGATEDQMAAYLANKVDPLVKRIGLAGPNLTLLQGKSKESFDEYIALNSYAEAILPRAVFTRAVRLGTSSDNAAIFGRAVSEVAAEPAELVITVPPVLKGQPFWVPINKGKIKGAKVLSTKGAWAKIQPTSATIIINNPPVD
jgi:hypothetical protein